MNMFQQQPSQDNFDSRNNFLRSARKGNKTGFELADGCIAFPSNNQEVNSFSLSSSSSETSCLCDAIVFKNHHNLFRYLNATCGSNNKRNKNSNKFTSFINFPRDATREFIKCYQDESICGWHVNRVFHLLESFIGVVFSIPAVMRVIKPHEHGLFEHLIFIMPGKLLVDCKINLNKGSRFKIEGFFTMNELCKYYNEPLNGRFKNLLLGLFDNMQAIENCFERDSLNLDIFWCQTKIRPFRLNIKLSQGLRNGIYHYFSCDGNCNSIACSKSANKLKRDVFFAVGSNARTVCDEIEEILSTKIVEAKYQIFVSKGKLQAEIVLFCNLAGDIVGFPIAWQHNEQKWIVVSMLVSQMKQNTMLPSLFVGHKSGLKNLCGNLLDLNKFVNLYGDCDGSSRDAKNNSGSGDVNLLKTEELKCKDVEKEAAQAQAQAQGPQQYVESQHQVRLLQGQSQYNYYNYNSNYNYNYNSNNYTNDSTYRSMPLTNSNMFKNSNNYWNVQNMAYSVGFGDESTGASNNCFNFNQTPPPITKTHSNTSLSSNNSNGNSVVSSIISSTSTGSYSNTSSMTGMSSTESVNSGAMMNNCSSNMLACPQYTQAQNVNVSSFASMNCGVNMNTGCDIRDMIQSGLQLRVALLNQLSQSTNNNNNNNNNNGNGNGNVSKLLVDQTNYFQKQLS